ncbi:hypothetical protein ABZ943_00450 [Streptomyces rubiginosohelvolus]|uniref:hypothetical protein n=1 Tax=Streptomyces rubiginosohelvolus TaxID=67362 RepID=UPI0034056E10
MADATAMGERRAGTGETYTALATGLVVEVLAGTGRNGKLRRLVACRSVRHQVAFRGR